MSYACCNIITVPHHFKECQHIKQMRRYLFQYKFNYLNVFEKWYSDSKDKFQDMTDFWYTTLSSIESLCDHTTIDYTQIRFVRNDAKAKDKGKRQTEDSCLIFQSRIQTDAFLVPYAIISQFPVSVDSTSYLCYPKCCISPWSPQDTAGTLKLR